MMKERIVILLACLMLFAVVPAQNSSKLRKLRSQREALQKKIRQSEQQLRQTDRTVKRHIGDLAVLNGAIDKQEKQIRGIQFQIDSITHHVSLLSNQLTVLNRQLEDKRQKYRRSVYYLFNNRNTQNKLLFILSAKDFTQMMRRYNYVREYAKYQRVQGMLIQRKEEQVRGVQTVLKRTRSERDRALTKQQEEKGVLVTQQDKQQKTVKMLQGKQTQVKRVLASNRKEMSQLSNKIDYYVRLAIEQEQKRRAAAERARKRREAEALAKAQAARKAEKKSSVRSSETVETKKSAEPMPEYKTDNKEYKLSQNFESNRGRLPFPITGSYVVSAHYGSYNMAGLSGVRLDNKGINITAKGGANARCIFNGEVSAIFSFGGLMNVLVRHGSYISVYCNLSSVSVSRGQQVSTRQNLGSVARDGSGNYTLHFQLRKETRILNPESWLAR